MIYAIALCLYVLCYVCIQIMFLFYGCHISQHKRKVFVILVVYTILFKGMDFLLLSPDPSAMPTTTYWVYWSVHTLDTTPTAPWDETGSNCSFITILSPSVPTCWIRTIWLSFYQSIIWFTLKPCSQPASREIFCGSFSGHTVRQPSHYP